MAESINLARCKGECGEAVSLVLLQRLRPFLFFSYTEDDMMTIPYHMVAPAGGPSICKKLLFVFVGRKEGSNFIALTMPILPDPTPGGGHRGMDTTAEGHWQTRILIL